MTLSRRHHYIPRFLIDKFSDSDKMVWVFNKEEGRILSTKRSSKSIFFEIDRNNFNLNGVTIDNIEKMYGEVDNLLARNLDKVLQTGQMAGRQLTLLIFLVSLTKWRIPSADKDFSERLKNIPIEDLGLSLRRVDGSAEIDEEEIKKIKEHDFMKEAKRLFLSIQPLIKGNLDEIHKSSFVVSYDKFPGLLGDAPIIERPNSDPNTLEDFVFPLSSNDTLICKRGADKYISQEVFYYQKDLTVFHQANKYVVSKSRDRLLEIHGMYSKLQNEKKVHLLNKYIFEFIR